MNDAQLSALFSGLDTRPEFNAQLLERLQQELAQDAQRAQDARRLEQLRHRVAHEEMRGAWRQLVGRFVNLETGGIAVLAVAAISSMWSADQIRQFMPVVLFAVGLLLAFAPLLAPVIRKLPWAA